MDWANRYVQITDYFSQFHHVSLLFLTISLSLQFLLFLIISLRSPRFSLLHHYYISSLSSFFTSYDFSITHPALFLIIFFLFLSLFLSLSLSLPALSLSVALPVCLSAWHSSSFIQINAVTLGRSEARSLTYSHILSLYSFKLSLLFSMYHYHDLSPSLSFLCLSVYLVFPFLLLSFISLHLFSLIYRTALVRR